VTRPRQQAYLSSEMSALSRQLLYSPPAKRAEVVLRAEQFHDELDAANNYPIDFVVYRLTHRRVPVSERVMLVGVALRSDLRLLIDALSQSIEMMPSEDDPCETTGELAKRLGVSTKTVARWRDSGLRWRWSVKAPGGKHGVMFTRSAVEAFQGRSSGRISSARRFTRLTPVEKKRLINRARRLSIATEKPPQAILRHLAKRTGRSVEALRLLLKKHDSDHPESRVFTDRTNPLTDREKQQAASAYAQGDTVAALCLRYGKSRSSIYRAIHESRASAAIEFDLVFVSSPMFEREDAEEVLLRPIERAENPRLPERAAIESLPVVLRPVYDQPIDTDEVTRTLIVRYNFLKFRAAVVQQRLREGTPRAVDLKLFDELITRATQTRREILSGTLPTVLSVVRRQTAAKEQESSPGLLTMLDTCNAVLIEEIERFDASRSRVISSLLTNRMSQALAKLANFWQPVEAAEVIRRLADAGFVATQAEAG